jgi:uncharacterized short protein YbdD (DUF466 family)
MPSPRALLNLLRDGLRAMVGVGSYAAYLDHHRTNHHDAPPMTEVEFFRRRQAAHFGAGGSRCC